MPQVRRMNQRKRILWPGLDERVSTVFDAVLRGVRIPANINLQDITVRKFKYFHRQSLGTTSVAGTYTFFQSQYAKFRTNLPQPGQLPNNYAFALQAVRINLVPGLTIAGAADTDGELFGGMSAAEAAAMDVQTTQVGALGTAEDARKILSGGQLQLKIGDKIIADCYDLTNFPSNRGLYVNTMSSTDDTGVTLHAAYFTNGMPSAPGGWTFTPAFPIVPGRQIQLDVSYETALTVVDVGWIMQAELEGALVTPANL